MKGFMSSDKTSDVAPTPQESLKENDVSSVSPLVQESASTNTIPKESNAGTLVLQWLTYAFWGWLILGVAYLVSITAGYTLNPGQMGDSIQEPVAYGIAAVLVLLPVAVLCDIFYSKQEVDRKKGASSIVMVIHAVLFALLGIGTLITIAFSLVNMLLSGYRTGTQVVLITAACMFILYFLTLVRTVKPFMVKKLRFIFRIVMAAVVVAVCIWGIAGPVAATARTKDDRAVSQGLTSLHSVINSYASSKGALPNDLGVVLQERNRYESSSWETIKDLIDRNLITYTPNTKAPSPEPSASDSMTVQPSGKTFYYELCGVYKYDAPNKYSKRFYGNDLETGGYSTYLESSAYHAGKNCTNLKTTEYSIY